MPVDFYYMPESPPCRAVELVANKLGLELNKKYLDLSKGEHLTEEFLKINPEHTVPTIVDGDLVLYESRVIFTYFVNKYGSKDDSLYPQDPVKRAKVDMMLYWDLSKLYKAQSDLLKPMIFGKFELDETKEREFKNVLKQLDMIVTNKQFCAGNNLTVADISIICGLTLSEACDYDLSEFKSLVAYVDRVKKSLPTYDSVSGEALVRFKAFINSKRNPKGN